MKNYVVLLILLCASFGATAQFQRFVSAGVAHGILQDPNGRVGIGTPLSTVPAEKLTVVGNVRASNYVTTTGILNTMGATVNMSFQTAGTTRMTLLAASGFFGIGITPTEMLHVGGNSLATGTATASRQISSTGFFQSAGTTDLQFNTNTTTRMSILSANGFVGIGMTPAEMLDVNGTVRSQRYTASTGVFSSTADLSLNTGLSERVKILNANGNVGIGISPLEKLHVSGNFLSTGTSTSDQFNSANGTFNSLNASGLSFATGGVGRIHVESTTGNVGIGVVGAKEKLHIKDGGLIIENGATPTIYTAPAAAAQYRYIQFLKFPGSTETSGLKTGGVLIADNYAYANPSPNDLVVKGTIAIGTPLANNPNGYQLAVNGKIGAKDVHVETKSSTWPDYVFQAGYQLPDLYAVEAYINANSHLKDVPSAKEIEKDHNLGEMDAILLKKMEELTLYIIEQQKQIDELKRKLEEQNKN